MMVDELIERGYSKEEIQKLLDDFYKEGKSDMNMVAALGIPKNADEFLYAEYHGYHPWVEATDDRNKKQEGGKMDNQMMMIMSKPTETEMEPE